MKTIILCGVHPHSKYGLVQIDEENNLVKGFDQKPLMYDYVSGGFMIFNKKDIVNITNEQIELFFNKKYEMQSL